MSTGTAVSWIIVRRYDQLNSDVEDITGSPPRSIELQCDLNYEDLKNQLQSWLSLPEDDGVVMKLRRQDGVLVTLSYLLNGSTETEPFLLDIARVHQSTPSSLRSALSATYIETVRNKVKFLEKRVERVENLIPELHSRRQASIEQVLDQLGTKVNFLDKRVDELVPLEWKDKLQ